MSALAALAAPQSAAILLVNDDPGTLFGLRAVLSDLDASIVTASSGDQALLRLLRQEFALIILDVKMAGLDGFETARLIRKRPRTRSTPIIFLTSHAATDLDRSQGMELGAADYIFMPVPPEVLKAKVKPFLDAARARAGQAEAAAPTVPQPAAPAPTPLAGAAACADAERLVAAHGGEYAALLDASGNCLYASDDYLAEFGPVLQGGARYLDIVLPADRERVGAALAQPQPSPRRLQYRVRGQADHYFESELVHVCGDAPGGAQIVLLSRDITERKEMEAFVLHQSFHDPLTGLPNRMLLEDRLRQVTAHRERARPSVAVLFLDLDHFKEVNDSLGHAAGDRLLQSVAERIGSCVRDGDTVARVGGDEFVVMLLGLHEAEDAALVADKIISAVGTPSMIEGRELHITPSVGIAIFPDDGEDADALLRNADIAMYHAKRDGGARFSFFAPHMQETASRRLALGIALQRAIAGGEFVQYYQPKVSARSGRIAGFEALIRWPQGDGSYISPSVFIPVAEESGRIDPISAWALRQTVAELQRWQREGVEAVPIAVNLSAVQFGRDTMAGELASAVGEAGIDPALLEVELTETGMMSNPALAVRTLHDIHKLGMSIAVDDFGTGYSSLAYLKRLPIDKLKIDASFVRDLTTDESDRAIVLAIITLAHILNLQVIAEGVETLEQVQFLVAHGCDEMQGNYFSAAVSNDEAIGLLRRGPFALSAPQGATP